MSHILKYKYIKELSIRDLIDQLDQSSKTQVADLKITDLFDDYKSVTGVYVFYDESNRPAYVGKASSRAFLERIGGHFDSRPFSYMNTFLFKLTVSNNKANTHESEFITAFKRAHNYRLICAALPNKDQISRLESILRVEMHPTLNAGRTRIKYTLDMKVKDI